MPPCSDRGADSPSRRIVTAIHHAIISSTEPHDASTGIRFSAYLNPHDDGSVQTWQSLANPDVLRAAGPIDPEISFVSIAGADGKPRGVLSNFALHLDTVGGLRWSGDFPFFIEQTLRKSYGPDLISVFGTGCCGDINHSDPGRKERNRTDMIGNSLGTTLGATLSQAHPLEDQTLQIRSITVSLPLQNPSAEQIERSRHILKLIRDGGKAEFLDQVTAYKTLMLTQFRPVTRTEDNSELNRWGLSHTWSGIGDALPVEVQTITLGNDVAIVFFPGEVFVELGLAIKRASPFRTTLVIELSNCVEAEGARERPLTTRHDQKDAPTR